MTGLWTIGAISLAIGTTQSWDETLYVEDEVASRAQCTLRFDKGWHASRKMDFEQIHAYWPEAGPKRAWSDIGIQAVHKDRAGQLVQIDTAHFQHRFRYREGFLVSIHTRDDWEDHEYVVIWRDGLPVKLVGYLEHIELVYDKNRLLTKVVETWLDEPEIKREMVFYGGLGESRMPLPFSMGWLFTREGNVNPDWMMAWWLSKQRFPDALAGNH